MMHLDQNNDCICEPDLPWNRKEKKKIRKIIQQNKKKSFLQANQRINTNHCTWTCSTFTNFLSFAQISFIRTKMSALNEWMNECERVSEWDLCRLKVDLTKGIFFLLFLHLAPSYIGRFDILESIFYGLSQPSFGSLLFMGLNKSLSLQLKDLEYILHHRLSKFDRSVFLILKPIFYFFGVDVTWFFI